MRSDERLREYRLGRFTDEDVVRCTGLSARGWRELIKFKVVRTIVENDRGRGHGLGRRTSRCCIRGDYREH